MDLRFNRIGFIFTGGATEAFKIAHRDEAGSCVISLVFHVYSSARSDVEERASLRQARDVSAGANILLITVSFICVFLSYLFAFCSFLVRVSLPLFLHRVLWISLFYCFSCDKVTISFSFARIFFQTSSMTLRKLPMHWAARQSKIRCIGRSFCSCVGRLRMQSEKRRAWSNPTRKFVGA